MERQRHKKQKTTFIDFLENHKIDIALVQETLLKPSIKFTIPNYRVYRTDRIEHEKGGTLIAVKEKIKHFYSSPPTSELETTAVTIHLKTGPISCISAYSKPKAIFSNTTWDNWFPDNKSIIYAGDFNAKHKIWGCNATNTKGRLLNNAADQGGFQINAPEEPTHWNGSDRPDILDIIIYKNIIPEISNLKVTHELNSDHWPILFEIGRPNLNLTLRQLIKFTDWKLFQNTLENHKYIPPIKESSSLDAAAVQFTENIKTALKAATIEKFINPFHSKNSISQNLKQIIKVKNQIKNRAARTGDPSYVCHFI